jgi:hypothetical protein
MATVGAQTAYATDITAVQRVYYHQRRSFWYSWMLVMSTQLIGFSIGGIARRFLVAPASMSKLMNLGFKSNGAYQLSVWPNTLVSCALFNTLHSQSYAGIGEHEGMPREKYFTYAFIAAVVWCKFFQLALLLLVSQLPRYRAGVFVRGVKVSLHRNSLIQSVF